MDDLVLCSPAVSLIKITTVEAAALCAVTGSIPSGGGRCPVGKCCVVHAGVQVYVL